MSFRIDDPAPRQRPLRSDARRNRERVLAAAEELFATGGNAVQVDDVARRAGVGVGTVCRNFPTKDDLLDAVLEASYRRLLEEALAVRDQPVDGSPLWAVALRSSSGYARHRALAERARQGPELSPATRAVQAELWALLSELVDQDQRAGRVRVDIGPGDVILLLAGVAQAASILGPGDPPVLERYVRLVLDGLRPGGGELPGHPLTIDELRSATTGGKAT